MERLKRLSRTQRIGIIIAGMFLMCALLLPVKFAAHAFPFPAFVCVLAVFLLMEWVVCHFIVYSIISLKTSWKDSTHALLGWLYTFLATIAIIYMFVQGIDAFSRLESRPNLAMQGSPLDKSCTLYFYRVGGDWFSGQDIDVTLEMADEPGKETFVCHLEKVHDLGLVWKSNTSFSINGKIYVIESGEAVPLEIHSE